jgi:hypothetical protein
VVMMVVGEGGLASRRKVEIRKGEGEGLQNF